MWEGNFNEVMFLEESKGRGMDLFGDFVDKNDLLDVPTAGSQFTWSNFQIIYSLSRLDRFLISMEWEECFSPIRALVLPRPGSNHKSLLL